MSHEAAANERQRRAVRQPEEAQPGFFRRLVEIEDPLLVALGAGLRGPSSQLNRGARRSLRPPAGQRSPPRVAPRQPVEWLPGPANRRRLASRARPCRAESCVHRRSRCRRPAPGSETTDSQQRQACHQQAQFPERTRARGMAWLLARDLHGSDALAGAEAAEIRHLRIGFNPMPVNSREASVSTKALSVKIWLRPGRTRNCCDARRRPSFRTTITSPDASSARPARVL